MGLIGTMAKAGLAKKAFNMARRPENQRKLKGLVANLRGGGSKR